MSRVRQDRCCLKMSTFLCFKIFRHTAHYQNINYTTLWIQCFPSLSTIRTLNFTIHWVKSSVAFLSRWNLSYSEVALGFSPVCWGWAEASDTTVSPAALLSNTFCTLLPIMCSLCCTERCGAGRNPNQHNRPRARQDVKSIRTHTFTHKNTQSPFILSHRCNQLHGCCRHMSVCGFTNRGVFSGGDPEYTHGLEQRRHLQSVSIRALIDNQPVSELGSDLPIKYTLLTFSSSSNCSPQHTAWI